MPVSSPSATNTQVTLNTTIATPTALTGDVNAHSSLWHSYTDDHRGQLIAEVISNSDHISLNTDTPTRVPNIAFQQTSSPDITTVSNTLYNRTSWQIHHALSSDHLPIMTTINIRHNFRLQTYRRTFTNYKKANWTQFTKDTELAFSQTTIPDDIHTANRIFTNIILLADKHNIPKGKMPSTSRLLLEHIVCKITQRDNIRRANPCDPALKPLRKKNDMSKAFDTVNAHTLIGKLLQTSTPGTIVKFVANYIKGRKAYTSFRNHKSIQRLVKTGVPQGGVLSPTLFNIHTADIPTPTAPVQVMLYADDITITSTHTSISAARKYIQPYLHKVYDWTQHINLIINPDKTTCTLFTPDPAEYNSNLGLNINNKALPMALHPKVWV